MSTRSSTSSLQKKADKSFASVILPKLFDDQDELMAPGLDKQSSHELRIGAKMYQMDVNDPMFKLIQGVKPLEAQSACNFCEMNPEDLGLEKVHC